VFRKDIKDFFGSRDLDATAELLEQYDIDQSYADGTYLLRTLQNVGNARITGMEFNYRQSLSPFLPPFARGINIRYNITQLHLEGSTLADFSAFIRKNQNWGISLDRPKYNIRLNWNSRGRQRQAAVAGNAEPGTFAYMHPRLTLDVEAEYRFSRHLGVFVGGRNVTGEPFIIERYAPNTPAYARRYQRDDYGVAVSVGIKGAF
jgi:outer membrane receptor protein involved in Fe transport